MSELILTILKRELDELAAYGGLDAETRRNKLKEALQYYVLNFVYHHPRYSKWVMYGGSALRIIHGLNRMSVDLDFEISHAVTRVFLNKLKKELEDYFKNTYGADAHFLTIKISTGRGLLLKFNVGEALSSGHASGQVHVKIDLNHFVAPQTFSERQPMNRGQFSFAIMTYNMAALMASKIAAIFLRGTRGVGKAVYEEKGRDIYDLLWYMSKKVIPDLDYLAAKGIDVKNPHALFDKITLRMDRVSDENLKQDIMPLFTDRTYVEYWLGTWRESYLRLLNDYKIHAVTSLEHVRVRRDLMFDSFSFTYTYKTKEGGSVQVIYRISEYWITLSDDDFPIVASEDIRDKIEFTGYGTANRPPSAEKLNRYAALFYRKTEAYFKKTERIMLGDTITTKLIRITADDLNPKEQIVLHQSALVSCELDDLLQ